MDSPSRLRWTIALAVVAHAGAFAWTARTRLRAPAGPMAPLSATEGDVEEVEIEASPAFPQAPLDGPESPSGGQPRSVVGARVDRHVPAAVPAGASSAGGAEAPVASAEPGGTDGSWTFSPRTEEATGAGPLGGALGAAVHAGIDQTLAEDRRAAVTKKPAILPRYTDRDYALGMVPGVSIATITKDRLRRSLVPDEAHALLQFDTDGAGVVASFRVLDASSARREWEELAAQIADDARAKPLPVPPGARGLEVTLDVSSTMRTVDGAIPPKTTGASFMRTLNDPIGAATRVPLVRVVAARVVGVTTY